MRIPYPERIPYSWATLVAAVLFVTQILQGTSAQWSLLCFCFIMLAVTGVNLAGGLYRPAGAYIFFNALLTLVVGVVAKAILGEAADSNLQAPMHLIEVYTAGMASLCFAALVDYLFRPRESMLTHWFPLGSLRTLFIGVITVGLVLNIFWMTNPFITTGSILSALHYGDDMLPFGVILGVMYLIRSSNGRRSINAFLVIVITLMTVEGMLLFTKQGLFTGPFAWAVGAGASRLRLRPVHFLTFGVLGFFLLYIGVPVVQAGKSLNRLNDPAMRIHQVWVLITKIQEVRLTAESEGEESYNTVNYYNQSEGFLDRLEMIGIDDLLIDQADREGFYGYEPTKEGWENLIPHFLWKDKPTPYFGNVYAHQLSLLDENDFTTGVSFSPSADMYKQGGFMGIALVETACFVAIFLVLSCTVGDIRDHPAGVVMVLIAAHAAPEGAMPGAIQLVLFAVIVLALGFFSRYISPIVSSAVLPPERLSNGALITALD